MVRADIKDCFEAIPRWSVAERLRSTIADERVVRVVTQLVNRHGVGPAAKRIRKGRGLHQGSPLSPVLTYLYLDSFDRAMLRHGHRVLRCSDDFAVPVTMHAAGEWVLELIESALRELDLGLNEDKSRIESFDEGVDFLGQIVAARSQAGTTTYVSPLEATVYVTESGSSIRSRGGRLRVMHRDRQLLSVPYDRVKQVV